MDQALKIGMVVLYIGVMFLIGLLASRKIKDIKDFFVGGKNLGYWVVSFSARATGESAWLLLGLTGMGAWLGLYAMWIVIGEVIGVTLAWTLMSHRFKDLTDSYESITIPDYLESRVKDTSHLVRLVSAVALILFPTIYVSAQFNATGEAFQAFLGWPYLVGAMVGFLIVLTYITIGGFVAVAWSDLIQGILMLGGLIVLPIAGIYVLGGFGGLWDKLDGISGMTNLMGTDGWAMGNILSIVAMLAIGLGYLGSPQVFVRFMSLKNKGELKKGTAIAILWTLLADAGAVLAGMAGRAIFVPHQASQTELFGILGKKCQNVLPLMTGDIFVAVLAAIYIAIVLAAIMSTVDSLLILASSALARDFYQKVLHPEISDEKMTRLARIYTFGLSTVAFCISMAVAFLAPDRTIFGYVVFAWSGIACTFCPVIILSIFWKGLSRAGTLAGMISGALGVIFFKFVPLGMFSKLEEMAPAFFLSLVTTILVSLVTSPPEGIEEDMKDLKTW